MELNLTGKIALVLGAHQEIGQATAQELTRLGCNICLLGRNEKKLIALKNQLREQTDREHYYLLNDNVTLDELRIKIEHFCTNTGGISILVTQSTHTDNGHLSGTELSAFELDFKQNIECFHMLTRLLLPYMWQNGFGRIINILSSSVKAPLHNLGVANTADWAVAGWAKTLSQEVAAAGITVNNVLIGAAGTKNMNEMITKSAELHRTSITEVEAQLTATIPAGRFARPEEIAAVVAFLSTPAASYVNGVAISVDGGRSAVL